MLFSISLMVATADILVRLILELSKYLKVSPHILTFATVSLCSALPETINSIFLTFSGYPLVGYTDVITNIIFDFTLVIALAILFSKEKTNIKYYLATIPALFLLLLYLFIKKYGHIIGAVLFLLYPATFYILLSKEKVYGDIPLIDFLKYAFLICTVIVILLVNARIVSILVKILIKQYPAVWIGTLLGIFTVLPELIITLVSYIFYKKADIALSTLFGTFLVDTCMGIGIPLTIVSFHPIMSNIALTILPISFFLVFLYIKTRRKEIALPLFLLYVFYLFKILKIV